MKSLILGASGQVGAQLYALCQGRGHDVFGTAFRHQRNGLYRVDLCDGPKIESLIRMLRPDVVYLPASFTNVDRAEEHPEECRAVNVDGTVQVAEAIRKLPDTKLVFFSTDHVFGDSERAQCEEEKTRPMSVYAQTKADAEEAIRLILPEQHLVLRTSWVYGPDAQGKNFVYRAVRTLRSLQRLTTANDQFGQPTYGPDLARATVELAEREHNGTYHIVGPDRLTRFAFARLIAHVYHLDADRVQGVPTVELKQSAPRPKQVWLARHKLRQALGEQPVRPVASALRELRSLFSMSTSQLVEAA